MHDTFSRWEPLLDKLFFTTILFDSTCQSNSMYVLSSRQTLLLVSSYLFTCHPLYSYRYMYVYFQITFFPSFSSFLYKKMRCERVSEWGLCDKFFLLYSSCTSCLLVCGVSLEKINFVQFFSLLLRNFPPTLFLSGPVRTLILCTFANGQRKQRQ